MKSKFTGDLLKDLWPEYGLRYKNEAAQAFIEAAILHLAQDISMDHRNVIALRYGLTPQGKKFTIQQIADNYYFQAPEGSSIRNSYKGAHRVQPARVKEYLKKASYFSKKSLPYFEPFLDRTQ